MKRFILLIVAALAGMIYFSGCSSRMYIVRPNDIPSNGKLEVETKSFRPTKLVIISSDGKTVTEVDSRPSDFYYRDANGNIVRANGYSNLFNGYWWSRGELPDDVLSSQRKSP